MRALLWGYGAVKRNGRPGLSTIGLLSRKDFSAFAVENAQSDRSRRPRGVGGRDNRRRHVRRLNLDLRQRCRSAIRPCAEKLDAERAHRGTDVRRFVRQPRPGRGTRLARPRLYAIGNQNGIHRQPHRGVDVFALADQARHRQCDKTPIPRDFVGAGLLLTSARLAVSVRAEVADQRLAAPPRPPTGTLATTRSARSTATCTFPAPPGTTGCASKRFRWATRGSGAGANRLVGFAKCCPIRSTRPAISTTSAVIS